MRQLDNLFGPHIKKFKEKFDDLPTIDISFSNVGNGENGESIYRVSIGYLDNFVSDLMSSDDEWERVGKMFDELTTQTTNTIRRMEERQNRMRELEIEMPICASNSYRVRHVDTRDFVPVMANEPVEVRPMFNTHWDGEIRDTGFTVQDAYQQFCDSIEEV